METVPSWLASHRPTWNDINNDTTIIISIKIDVRSEKLGYMYNNFNLGTVNVGREVNSFAPLRRSSSTLTLASGGISIIGNQ